MTCENQINFCGKRRCCVVFNSGELDKILGKSARVNFLSTEGKILSVLNSQSECIVKDIPSMAGVSPRAAFDCLKKLIEIGLVTKMKSSRDARARCVKLEFDVFCEIFCGRGRKGIRRSLIGTRSVPSRTVTPDISLSEPV